MVYGIIEVKTTLKRAALEEAFKKCAAIRAMANTLDAAPNKMYVRQIPAAARTAAQYEVRPSKLPPRFFVFGYDGWKKAAALEANFKSLSREREDAHIHGVCNLYNGGSLYIRHQAFQEGENRFYQVSRNGFRYFLMNLPTMLDSMLPVERIGIGFDQIHLRHYHLSVE